MKFILTLLLGVFIVSSQTNGNLTLSGEQTKTSTENGNQLLSTSLKIESSYKISKVEGNCSSFWIQKGNITIHKFNKLDKSIGTVLKAGKYTVYPELKKGQEKAKIKLTLTKTT